jgi:hypothetical protein
MSTPDAQRSTDRDRTPKVASNLEHGRVAQQAEHPVDRKPSGMAQVVDGEVAGSSPAPANTPPTEIARICQPHEPDHVNPHPWDRDTCPHACPEPECGAEMTWDDDWSMWCCNTCGGEYDDAEIRPWLHSNRPEADICPRCNRTRDPRTCDGSC